MTLKEFLVSTREYVNDLQSRLKIHIVIGNESCDLDSTVSAITYAYFLHTIKARPGTFYLPVLNIPRDKFRLRLEIIHFLQKHNITSDHLTFVDDLDLVALTQNKIVTLTATLVDHHVLNGTEKCLEEFVTEVLDHRPQHVELPESWDVDIKPVGSCCTLVANQILDSDSFAVDATVAELLLGTILSDTGNMSTSDKIATAEDHEALVKLKSFLPPSISATSIYEEIRNSKFDLSSLTVLEMLQKDTKILHGSQVKVVMSSVAMDLEEILARPEFSEETSAFCASIPADVLIIMTVVMGDTGVSRRCVAVFSENRVYREQITDVLLRSSSPNLDLQPMAAPGNIDNISPFIQNNLQINRKTVLPLISNFLAGETTTPDENVNATGIQSYSSELESGSSGDMGDNSEEETRRHINLAKTYHSDQFRTSQDRYDLAAVGTNALLSPSLSSDSELSNLGRRKGEEEETDNDGLDNIREEERASEDKGGDLGSEEDRNATGVRVLSAVGAGDGEDGNKKNGIVDNLIDFGTQDNETVVGSDKPASNGAEKFGILSGNMDDFFGELSGNTKQVAPSQNTENADLLSDIFSGVSIGEKQPSKEDALVTFVDTTADEGAGEPSGSKEGGNSGEDTEDVLQNHSPFDLLCPNNVDSPMDFSSMPTSGQASGQGSKVPSYPDTPPNSYMEPSGAMYYKETQLPSFNSSEMVKRIQEKKAALGGHGGKRKKSDNYDEDDGFDGLYVGGGSSGGGSSLISPAVPQNSYVDLTGAFDVMSSGHQLPKLTNSDIMARVNEKRSQFEWSVESLDPSSGVDIGLNSEESAQKSLFSVDGQQQIPVSATLDPQIPYTPQNSYVDGSFDSYARTNLPSMNSAEMVSRIKAKQSAMFGGSSGGGSSRVSRSSHGSDDSGGCRSPDIAGKSSRGASLDSPLQPYTPQNSYRDNLGVLDPRNRLPDLNEVAERLSIENTKKRFGKQSASHSGDGSRDEDIANLNVNQQNQARQGRNSSSQSDSQNTMSDVDSLMSVSTDVGTPSENVVAAGIAGQMRNDISALSRKDTADSDVFTPTKIEDAVAAGSESARPDVGSMSLKANGIDLLQGDQMDSSDGLVRKSYAGAKELFSPVDSSQLHSVEDHSFFEAAESIVAQSVAAALQVSQRDLVKDEEISALKLDDPVDVNCVDEESDYDEDDHTKGNSDDEVETNRTNFADQNSNSEQFTDNFGPQNQTQDIMVMDNEAANLHTQSQNQNPFQDALQEVITNHKDDNNEEVTPEKEVAATTNPGQVAEQNLADLALNELAFELANELIQSVLEDFPFSQDTNQDRQGGAKTWQEGEESHRQESLSRKTGLENNVEDTTDFEAHTESGQMDNADKISVSSAEIPTIRDEGDFDTAKSVDTKAADENLRSSPGITVTVEEKPQGTLLDSRKYSGSSLDSNCSSSSSERKRSRDTDSSLTIVEDEVMTSFPERKTSSEFITVEEEEEIMHSFPGRKFSKSEDFPARRFSRDENSSRRSSRMEDYEDYDIPNGPDALETDYLPNMDPLQGNLDIIDASFTKITDTDREVVEGESFRKVSGQEFMTPSDDEELDEGIEEEYGRRLGEDVVDGRQREEEEGIDNQMTEKKDDAAEEESLFEETSLTEDHKKPMPKNKKKIRVSFSEDFDDELGDFNISSSSRSALKSPPPPVPSQNSATSTPPPLMENVGVAVAVEQSVSPSTAHKTSTVPSLSSASEPAPQPPKGRGGMEVYQTSAGRISISGEEEGGSTSSFSGDASPRFSSSSDQALVKERMEVGKIIESVEETISEADHDLAVFDVTPASLPRSVKVDSHPLHEHDLDAFMQNPLETQTKSSSTPLDNNSDTAKSLDSHLSNSLVDPSALTSKTSVTTDTSPSEYKTMTSDPLDLTQTSNANVNLTSDLPVVTSDPLTSNQQQGQRTPALSQPEPVRSDPLSTHSRNPSNTSFGSVKGAVYKDEWQDDEIDEVAAQSGIEALSGDQLRKKIVPDSSFAQAIAADDDDVMDDDDADEDDNDSDAGDLEWENDTPVKITERPGIEPTLTQDPREQASQRWKRVSVSGSEFNIDLHAVEPYKSVLSHGGYYDEGLSAIIVFYGCHLPSRRQEDYSYIMNHLFHYVIHTLEELVANDYVIIYFHGSTPRRQMPGLGWLKRCYQSIDRRLKKNLKGLFLVHPTLWLRTIVTMIRPFISSKFSSKLKFVRNLEELNSLVPMDNVSIPEAIVQLEELLDQNPHFLEEQEAEEQRQIKEEKKEEKRKEKERKKDEKERKKQEKKEEKEKKKALKKEKSQK